MVGVHPGLVSSSMEHRFLFVQSHLIGLGKVEAAIDCRVVQLLQVILLVISVLLHNVQLTGAWNERPAHWFLSVYLILFLIHAGFRRQSRIAYTSTVLFSTR
jgi:hypothetical protein